MPPFKLKNARFYSFLWYILKKSQSTAISKMLKSAQGRKHLCLFFLVGKLRHRSVKGLTPDPVWPQWQNPWDAEGRQPINLL